MSICLARSVRGEIDEMRCARCPEIRRQGNSVPAQGLVQRWPRVAFKVAQPLRRCQVYSFARAKGAPKIHPTPLVNCKQVFIPCYQVKRVITGITVCFTISSILMNAFFAIESRRGICLCGGPRRWEGAKRYNSLQGRLESYPEARCSAVTKV